MQAVVLAGGRGRNVEVCAGDNDHHKVEAAFKALALALRAAVKRDGSDSVPSEKGVL